ncbi:MAG: RHS repeat-associated core domain-containing protein, partial [Limisphaerales bacterium]
NGTSLTYSYDDLNRLTNVVDRYANSTIFGYDAVGNMQSELLPNGVTNIYTYDSLNRLTNLTSKTDIGTIASFTYELNAAGTRTNLAETLDGASRNVAWSYDPLSRLTNEVLTGASPTGTIGYQYDVVGNRTSRSSTVSGVAAQSPSYNSDDELSSDNYDANGSTTNSSGNSFAYDVENHLTNYNNGAATYIYDGDGDRVRKTVSGVTTYYLVDDNNPSGYAQVLEELSTVGSTPTRLYTYGLNLISQRQSGGTTSFYGYDGNGDTRFLTSSSGTISDTYTYDAFGDLISSIGSTPNNYLYTGEQYDPNLGFYYLRARYMNPVTGRFWTRDSVAGDTQDPLSLHKYLYAEDNPVMGIDPSGHGFSSLQAAAVGRQVHQIIGLDFVSSVEGGISGSSIAKILRLSYKVQRLFPDLVDVPHKEVFEIKPITIAGTAQAAVQLGGYILALNEYDPTGGGWHVGNAADYTYTKPIELADPPAIVVVFPPVFGIIYYKAETLQDFVKARAENVAEEESADVEDSIDLSTLTTVIAF